MANKKQISTAKQPQRKRKQAHAPKYSAEAANRQSKKTIKSVVASVRSKLDAYLNRRPHRSFRRTVRRDYVRSLTLPGYIAFSNYVIKNILANRRLFGGLLVFYVTASALLVGVASQDTYSQLSSLLDSTASEAKGGWGTVGQAGLLLITSLSGGLNPSFTEVQQVYSVLLLLLVWLAVVWALRAQLAGSTPKFRDVLYSSGAPIVSTAVVFLVVIIQLVPVALAFIAVSTAIATGMFESPIMSLIISLIAGGLSLLSIYWITSTIIALVVVTLPGMYPWRAIQTAGDLVIGRRLRILLRLIWMLVAGLVFSATILLPSILIDRAIKQAVPAVEWIPFVPAIMAVVSSMVVVWLAAYVYLLYRKVVEDDANPA